MSCSASLAEAAEPARGSHVFIWVLLDCLARYVADEHIARTCFGWQTLTLMFWIIRASKIQGPSPRHVGSGYRVPFRLSTIGGQVRGTLLSEWS